MGNAMMDLLPPPSGDPEVDRDIRKYREGAGDVAVTAASVIPAMAVGGLNAIYAGANIPSEDGAKGFNLDAAIQAMHKAEEGKETFPEIAAIVATMVAHEQTERAAHIIRRGKRDTSNWKWVGRWERMHR